ncbi:MAG: choice-of-anchor J domain-containing protein [Bacteroidales bacterium]|nr:choice-of-anchor J domain-containing protein [Bacteroidales bacterium]
MKKGLLSIIAMAVLMLATSVSFAQTTYTKVTSASGLEAGAQYILVGFDNDGQAFVMSYQKSNNRHAIAIDESDGTITATVATDPSQQDMPFEFTLGGSAGDWTLYDPLNEGYLYAPGGGNYLRTQSALDDGGKWTITDGEEGGMVPVSHAAVEQNIMRYNITSTLFGCYKESSNVSATVYFYKAGGAAAPDPEPTNYPTNFSASLAAANVTLRWVDATGAQLPSKYLVVGSIGAITVPVDGTPVANGELTANVNYGVQEVVFSGLQSNTTYHFAIFPYTNSGANIDYKTDGSYPTAEVQVEALTVLLDEDFEDGALGEFVAINLVGDQEWAPATYNENTYAYMNGYADGAAHANEDWLITNELNGNFAFIFLSFSTAKKFNGDDLRVMVSSNYDGVSNPNQATWEDLTSQFTWSTGNYTWTESGAVNIASSVGQRFYLAFAYTSSDEGAAAWEVDNVKLIASNSDNVAEAVATDLTVAPNPANDMVRFTLDQQAQVVVYDLTGRMVSDQTMGAGANTLSVAQLDNGVYFLNVRYADGKSAVARFVKF